MRRAPRVVLNAAERRQLRAWARSSGPSRLSVRARIVLLAADGLSNGAISGRLSVNPETVARWRSRFIWNRLDGLAREAPRGGSARRIPRATVRRILRATASRSPADGRPWTTRSLARALRLNHMTVHRVWRAQGLGNPRVPQDIPDGAGARPRVDLVGAYLAPAVRALAFSVDRCPATPRAPSNELPELVPNPTGTPAFSGPAAASEEIVRAVASVLAPRAGRRGHEEGEKALLVFLRGVERTAGRSQRLELVFDRPVARLGRRAARWLAVHGRFRVYTSARPEGWADAVDGWVRRWASVRLDRSSFTAGAEFASRLSAPQPNERAAFEGFSWRSAIGGPTLLPPPIGADPRSLVPSRSIDNPDRRTAERRA